MTEPNTHGGEKLFICVSPQPEPLEQAAFAALDYIEVMGVGSIGERGPNTNIVSYDMLATTVSLKGKGITNAGDPAIECAEDRRDPGQTAMRAAGAPTVRDSYALKIERVDGTIEYWRGLVTGPVTPGGRAEDFRLANFTVALNQLPIFVDPPVVP